MPYWIRDFMKRYGILLLALAILWADSTITAAIVRRNTTAEVTEQLTARYEAEYAAKLEQYQQEQRAAQFKSGEASLMAAMDQEADVIARAIGTMQTKRMKLTMLWNILARVDSPFYPNNVLMLNFEAVVAGDMKPNREIDSYEWIRLEDAPGNMKDGTLAKQFMEEYIKNP